MPTIQQLVRKGRETLVEKGKSPAIFVLKIAGRNLNKMQNGVIIPVAWII